MNFSIKKRVNSLKSIIFILESFSKLMLSNHGWQIMADGKTV